MLYRHQYQLRSAQTSIPVPEVPVLMMSYRTYRSVRYRYESLYRYRRCTGTGGTGIHVVPNLRKCPVPVLMSYRTYRTKCLVPVLLMSYRTYRRVQYRKYCRYVRRYASVRTAPNTPRVQSWVSTIQSIVLTADVSQFISIMLPITRALYADSVDYVT